MTRRLVPLLAATALALPACGGGDSDAGDLARFAPASSVAYAEAVLRPEGDLKADLEAAAKKALATDDPGAWVTRAAGRLFDKRDVDFQRDIEPWLGERAAIAFTSFTTSPQGFIAVATTDEERALETVTKGDRVTEKTHRDVEYSVVQGVGGAATTLDGVLLLGSERGIQAAIDASKAEEDQTLAGLDRYDRAREDAEADDAAAFAYVDMARALRAVSARASARNPQAGMVLGALDTIGLQTLGVAATGDEQALRVRGVLRSQRELPGAQGEAADALQAAPADSILAVGIGDIGATFDATIKSLGGITGVAVEALFDQIRREQGLDVRRDLLDWMGDATLFVRGASTDQLGGAIVVQSKDPARSRAALPRLARLLRAQGLPLERQELPGADDAYALVAGGFEVGLASAGERVVLGFGQGALSSALRQAGGTLGQSPAFRGAAGELRDGIEPALFVDTAKLAGLLRSQPEAAEAVRVLQRFGGIVAGGSPDGQLTRFEIVGALR